MAWICQWTGGGFCAVAVIRFSGVRQEPGGVVSGECATAGAVADDEFADDFAGGEAEYDAVGVVAYSGIQVVQRRHAADGWLAGGCHGPQARPGEGKSLKPGYQVLGFGDLAGDRRQRAGGCRTP